MRPARILVAAFVLSLTAYLGIAATVYAADNTGAANAPAPGSTMEQVEKTFGKPGNVVPAVGDPPITRWIYEGFTVYFEHDRVIHSVSSDKKPPAQK